MVTPATNRPWQETRREMIAANKQLEQRDPGHGWRWCVDPACSLRGVGHLDHSIGRRKLNIKKNRGPGKHAKNKN